jgi:hypothetical protein
MATDGKTQTSVLILKVDKLPSFDKWGEEPPAKKMESRINNKNVSTCMPKFDQLHNLIASLAFYEADRCTR